MRKTKAASKHHYSQEIESSPRGGRRMIPPISDAAREHCIFSNSTTGLTFAWNYCRD